MSENPTPEEFVRLSREACARGWMIETSPGKFMLTEEGKRYVEQLFKTPHGKEMKRRTKKAIKRAIKKERES